MKQLTSVNKWVFAILLVLLATPGYAAKYFVDYQSGDDLNSGTSASAPFKHSPGDPQANGLAGRIQLSPGDTVIFRGGVVYRGSLMTIAAGEVAFPIIYDGNTDNTFGDGPAVIDGSDIVSSLVPCGMAGILQTYCAPLPDGIPEPVIVYQGNQRAGVAQVPRPANYYAQDNTSEYFEVDQRQVTETSLVASEVASLLTDDWTGASVLIWGLPNKVYSRQISSFDPATSRIGFDAIQPYTDRPTRYAIYNHPGALQAPGQFVVSKDRKTLRLILFHELDQKKYPVTVSVRHTGIDIRHPHTHVQGFVFQKYVGSSGEHRNGAGIRVSGDRASTILEGVKISRNESRYNSSLEGQGAITVSQAPGAILTNNYIHHNTPNRGILVLNSEGVITANNMIRNNSGTGIAYFGSVNGELIGNTIDEIVGNHSNGISLYLGSHNSLVCSNRVRSAAIALTTKHTRNLLFAFNVLDTYENAYTVADWGEGGGSLRFYNNLIINEHSKGLYINENSRAGLRIINNVIDGGILLSSPEYSHNLYTSLAWNQAAKYGWKLGEGERQLLRSAIYVMRGKKVMFQPSDQARPLLRQGREVDLSACGLGIVDFIGVPYLAPPSAPALKSVADSG